MLSQLGTVFLPDAQDFLPWMAASITGSYMLNESFLEAAFSFNGGAGVALGLVLGNHIGDELGAAIGAVIVPAAVEGKIDDTVLAMAAAGYVVHLAKQYVKKNKR